ncbi:MAG TPA: cell division protein FtsL [Nitrospiraceae bacterium]|nr:cell division protein FtsL [Nitrospiraceae bacterium]
MKGLIFAALTFMILLFVWERVDVVRLGYQIERLKSQKVLLERERDELRVRLSSLTSPERIARAATEKLNMALPEKGQVVLVHLEPDSPPLPPLHDVEGEVRLAKNVSARRTK